VWASLASVAVTAALAGGCADNSGSSGLEADSGADDPQTNEVEVVEVVDGDTVRVRLNDHDDVVRAIGIHTPEVGECLADEAVAQLEGLLASGPVRLERDVSDRDRFGRLLRYVFAGEQFVNAEMVEAGVAIARSFPPDTAGEAELERAEDEAQEAGRGIRAPAPCGPRADASLTIVAIEADPPGNDVENLNGEWVESRNDGAHDVDLTGWVLRDESATHRFAFPHGFVLGAGATVRILSGCGTDTLAGLHWCVTGSAVWNNDGDTAFLLDPSGNIAARRSYSD
jgi:micrococcal nuclease